MTLFLRIVNVVGTVIIAVCVSRGMATFIPIEWVRIVFDIAIVIVGFVWIFIANGILKILGHIGR